MVEGYHKMLSVYNCELAHAKLLLDFQKVLGYQCCGELRGLHKDPLRTASANSCVLLQNRVHYPSFQIQKLR